MEDRKSFIGGFFAAIAISILSGTDAGRAIVRRLRDRYDLTMLGIRRMMRVFWVAEGILILFASLSLYAENYTTAAWMLSIMGAPFLAMMFFIKALFPKSKRAVRGIAIPILMLFDVGIMGLLIFAPILWTGPVWVLLYLSLVRIFADYGMITGIDTNKPYSLTVTAVVLVLIIHGGLSWTGYKNRIEKYHQEMYYVNLQQSTTYMVATENITPYQLFDDELEEIASGHTTVIQRVVTYINTGTKITKGTRVKVCNWVPVVISLTGVPNIVVATAGVNGDFNPNGTDVKELKKQFFLVPLEKLKSETELKREFSLIKQARADSLEKATPVRIITQVGQLWKPPKRHGAEYIVVLPPGCYLKFKSYQNKGVYHEFDNTKNNNEKRELWRPSQYAYGVEKIKFKKGGIKKIVILKK